MTDQQCDEERQLLHQAETDALVEYDCLMRKYMSGRRRPDGQLDFVFLDDEIMDELQESKDRWDKSRAELRAFLERCAPS